MESRVDFRVFFKTRQARFYINQQFIGYFVLPLLGTK